MHCPEAGEWHPIKVFPKMKVAHSLSLSTLARVLEIAEKHPVGRPRYYVSHHLLPSLVFPQADIRPFRTTVGT